MTTPTPDVMSPRATVDTATAPQAWTVARLIDPSTAGFLFVGASTGSWRLPIALPSARRRRTLKQLETVAFTLRRDPRVARADIFAGLVRPPGRGPLSRDVSPAAFDAVLLVETHAVSEATALLSEAALADLARALASTTVDTSVFAGSNVRRIGAVDHDRLGVFLFNYFSAPDTATNLFAWQYTAGWFQDQTGLDNSTVVQPTHPRGIPYTLVNHCRSSPRRTTGLAVQAQLPDLRAAGLRRPRRAGPTAAVPAPPRPLIGFTASGRRTRG